MTRSFGVRFVTASMALAAGVLVAQSARAQEEWKEEGGEKLPPDDRPSSPKKADAPPADDANAKPTRFLVDLKIGPAFILSAKAGRGSTQFGLQLNFGYALAHDLAAKNDALYLTLSPYLVVGSDLTLVAPLGVQYDMPLRMIPYEGLWAYARTSVGYAYYQAPGNSIDKGNHGFAVQPAIGARVSFFERFHAGVEPFGLDIIHTIPPKSTAQTEQTIVAFQFAIFGGARF